MHYYCRKLLENGLVERHNAILGLTVAKTIEETKCDLEMAVAWAVSAKNSLKNVNGFSPNQLVFGKNPNFPNVSSDNLPALENIIFYHILLCNVDSASQIRMLIFEFCIVFECSNLYCIWRFKRSIGMLSMTSTLMMRKLIF